MPPLKVNFFYLILHVFEVFSETKRDNVSAAKGLSGGPVFENVKRFCFFHFFCLGQHCLFFRVALSVTLEKKTLCGFIALFFLFGRFGTRIWAQSKGILKSGPRLSPTWAWVGPMAPDPGRPSLGPGGISAERKKIEASCLD